MTGRGGAGLEGTDAVAGSGIAVLVTGERGERGCRTRHAPAIRPPKENSFVLSVSPTPSHRITHAKLLFPADFCL